MGGNRHGGVDSVSEGRWRCDGNERDDLLIEEPLQSPAHCVATCRKFVSELLITLSGADIQLSNQSDIKIVYDRVWWAMCHNYFTLNENSDNFAMWVMADTIAYRALNSNIIGIMENII